MNSILHRFSFESVKFNNQILFCAILIWLVVLGCTLSSLLSQQSDKRWRTFWIAIMVAFPLVGVLAYLPFSFKYDDMPFLFRARPAKRHPNRKKSF